MNPGPVDRVDELQSLLRPAVKHAKGAIKMVVSAARASTTARVEAWSERVSAWEDEADALIQRKDLKQRRVTIEAERALADSMAPNRHLVRPLLVVVPSDWESDFTGKDA
jgi:hypothetical protein